MWVFVPCGGKRGVSCGVGLLVFTQNTDGFPLRFQGGLSVQSGEDILGVLRTRKEDGK